MHPRSVPQEHALVGRHMRSTKNPLRACPRKGFFIRIYWKENASGVVDVDLPHVDTDMTEREYCAHDHEEPEIITVRRGSPEMTVNGQTKTVAAGDIAAILPFRIHSLKTAEDSRR